MFLLTKSHYFLYEVLSEKWTENIDVNAHNNALSAHIFTASSKESRSKLYYKLFPISHYIKYKIRSSL